MFCIAVGWAFVIICSFWHTVLQFDSFPHKLHPHLQNTVKEVILVLIISDLGKETGQSSMYPLVCEQETHKIGPVDVNKDY